MMAIDISDLLKPLDENGLAYWWKPTKSGWRVVIKHANGKVHFDMTTEYLPDVSELVGFAVTQVKNPVPA